MATYLKGIVFDNQTMTPKAFGRAMENALSDGTLNGCAVTFSGTNVTLGSGYLIAKGREAHKRFLFGARHGGAYG